MKVTKYPAVWVNAAAPTNPANAARIHDNRASRSNISRITHDIFPGTSATRDAGTASLEPSRISQFAGRTDEQQSPVTRFDPRPAVQAVPGQLGSEFACLEPVFA
ncbi:hypothetical protein MKCMC460_45790 [Mycobacterium sp. 20KCMC460]|nr:hypothetical protein IWGMT90018_46290 [Mycobacterium kiyosense]BDE15719.1 hypothetical protein MKCMC460_45790 [Mycobacterium sp. 20KCMC460]GLB99575.1 hypothetical protein SRL2020400_01670 [Mycobacterium kiyosense]